MTHFCSPTGAVNSHISNEIPNSVFCSLHAVISRNILNDEASALVSSENAVDDKNLSAEFQLAAVDMPIVQRDNMDNSKREDRNQEVLLQDDTLTGNRSAAEGKGVESESSPSHPVGGAVLDVDAAKPAHADEM